MADDSIFMSDRFDRANEIYELADTIARDIKYDEDKFFELLSAYAEFCYTFGKYNKSLDLYKRQIDILDKNNLDSHIEYAISYICIGENYDALSDYESAMKHYNAALDIIKETSLLNSLTAARLYTDIGVTFHNTNNYQDAIFFYNKALEVSFIFLDTNHEFVVELYENLAEIYEELEDYKKALEYRLLALPGQEKEWTNNSIPYMSNQYYYIAEDYNALLKPNEAIAYYRKALSILERFFTDIPPIIDIKEKIAALKKK